jgi:hypothetical protein
MERYLEPLKDETFLSNDDTEQLFVNIHDIIKFQKTFLESLESCSSEDDAFESLTVRRRLHFCMLTLYEKIPIDFHSCHATVDISSGVRRNFRKRVRQQRISVISLHG